MNNAIVAVHQQMLTRPNTHRCEIENVAILIFVEPWIEGGRHGGANVPWWRFFVVLSLCPLILHELNHAIAVWNMLIHGKLIVRPDADHQSDCHAGGEAEDIDER